MEHRTIKRGFTLIELLVVIAIIAILAAMLFPVYAQAKQSAQRATSISNAKQIILATLMYGADYDDRAPRSMHLVPGSSFPQPINWLAPYQLARVIDPYIKTGRGCMDNGDPNGSSLWWDPADPQRAQRFMWGSYITNGIITGIGRSLSSLAEPSSTVYTALRAPNWGSVVDVAPPVNPGPSDKFWETEWFNMGTIPWYNVSMADSELNSPYTFGSGMVAPPCSLFPTDQLCLPWESRLDRTRYNNQAIYSFADGHARSRPFAATYRSVQDNMWDAF